LPPCPLLLTLALAAAPAPAEHEPETRAFQLSRYEDATIDQALAQLGLARDARPEGKLVEAVHTVRLEVIEERDPAPRLLNVFHVVSRPGVIERELLLRPGDRYRQTLADETRRNLAGLPQLSIVLVVAAEGSDAGHTRLVVVTKDVWSLRLNWDASFTSGGLERLSMNPSETNLLGTHQRLGVLLDWLPESWSLGVNYAAPRLGRSRIGAAADGGVILSRRTGTREGSFGGATVALPLWSTRSAWAWSVGGSWRDEIARLYRGGEVATFVLDPATSCAGPSPLCLPFAWRGEVAQGSASLTRSFGWAVKHDLSAGFDASTSRYAVPGAAAYDPATVSAFEATRLPVGEDRVGPWIQYRTYSTDFLRVLDLETLALQEDHRVGHAAYATLYPVLGALGSTRTFVGVGAGAAYAHAIGDGLARAGVDTTTETDDGDVTDASVRADLRLASPRTRAGRLIVDAVLLDRWANQLNRSSSLGGGDRLRGWPSGYVVGANVVAANVELRSRPWQLLESLQLGAVAFYDAGDAFDDWGALYLRQSVGLGARMLFPQLDRVVFRVDLGFPLARPADVAPASFVATFGQAFSP
jgi:hypothetical protein